MRMVVDSPEQAKFLMSMDNVEIFIGGQVPAPSKRNPPSLISLAESLSNPHKEDIRN
jgi:hypothetical protein